MQLSSKLLVGPILSLSLALPPPALAQRPGAPERRDLSIRLDLGGTEPGTSKQAFEGVAAYRGVKDYDLQAGYTYTDQVYYTSNRGFVSAYRFYADGMSYVKADATLRKYDYPVDPAIRAPNPDSNSYAWVPRGELEISHRFTPRWRAGAQYQIFPASFFWDKSSWTVNNKFSADVEFRPVSQLRLGARAALLRDPDPDKTAVLGRPLPNAPAGTTCTPPGPDCAARTTVAYRTTSLVGGWAAAEIDRVGVKLEYLPNRDLDNSYDWSLLTTLDVRVTNTVDVRLQQVHDAYASVSNFPGKTGNILMVAAGYQASDALRLRAGFRYVDTPNRTGGTVIVGLELRPALR